MIDIQTVREYVNSSPDDDDKLQWCLAAAEDFVYDYLGPLTSCPVSLQELAILQGTARLWEARNSPNASVQWSPDGSSMAYLPRDIFAPVKATLRKYKPLGGVG